jgi:ornithine decarboxylase antizyme 1
VGEFRNPSDHASQGFDTENNLNETDSPAKPSINSPSSSTLVKRFKFRVSASNSNLPPWDSILWQGRLYVNVSSQQLSDGSKEAFVSLLEYAEETLDCSHVVVCLDQQLRGMKAVVRNFLFLGFQPLAPGHEFLPKNPNLACFVYTI